MFFSKLLPKEGNFFVLFNRHIAEIDRAAQAFSNLVQHYDDVSARVRYTSEVTEAEHDADKTTVEILRLLYKTFITPIAPELIHTLTNSMDDVADTIQDVALALSLYDVQEITPEIVKLTELVIQGCSALKDAISRLEVLNKGDSAREVIKDCQKINDVETLADQVQRDAISDLFRKEPDVRELIKNKAIYEQLEEITDRCEDVANVIEHIVLENS